MPYTEDYDEVDIEQMEYSAETELFTYPCPCGDMFEISLEDLMNGEEVATCPSCSLIVKVNYLQEDIDAALQMRAEKQKAPIEA
ncbi:diphthamide biosynthesis protein 3 [Nematocida major]|uniref:diphthamide biosynthesis protein 3 n=1 Tax=Nematocida major TaxID=1912982 RepID=UPI0020085134|nr:diphthamide biosynthesis protein 3 [Nematocida major]KAH9385787.1 diphthamide biosynthesis protein 3 [Nematocida major]